MPALGGLRYAFCRRAHSCSCGGDTGGHGFEVPMQARAAQAGNVRQIGNADGLRMIVLHPRRGTADPRAVTGGDGKLARRQAVFGLQKLPSDLAPDHQRGRCTDPPQIVSGSDAHITAGATAGFHRACSVRAGQC